MPDREGHLSTKVIHAGQSPEPTTGAVMPPVFQTSTYAQPRPAQHTGYEYARTHNPTREALERCVAALEGGTEAIAFGSGLAATTSLLLTLPAGAHVVASDDLYGGTYRLFERVMARRDLSFSYVDFTTVDPADAIGDGVAMVWIETPTNPLLKVTDLAAVSARCRAVGAKFAVDNTFATPIFQRPIEHGADYVVHSMTKYLNGHSDVVAGIVIGRTAEDVEPVRFMQNSVGSVPGPWDAWLTLRGLKTLAVRMDRHQHNAKAIVKWLSEHPRVKRLHYPLLESDPGFGLANRQMDGFGGMVSFVLDATLAEAEDFVSATKIFTLAESLGGVESLIELPASMTHASVPPEQRAALGIDDGLVRLSIGIEHVDDLVADLDQAMAASLR
ncbi:MAG: PLP-dependent aspartate aminotransferase family protein [Myxococcota bacterium]